MKETSLEIKNNVVNLRNQGFTYKEISENLNLGKGTISKICKDNGIAQSFIELTTDKIQECQDLYNQLGNIKKVAKQMNISYERLKTVIKLNEVISTKTPYERIKEHRSNIKKKCVEYKGGKCERCGYDKCIGALDFHHLDPSQKDFGISTNIKSFDLIKKELDKCILLCANCHREEHYNK